MNIFDLHDYQRRAVELIEQNRRLGLWADCGLGKTIITLTAIRNLLNAGKIKKALVIAPKNIAENVWAQEALLWEHTRDLKISLIIGNEKKRLKALEQTADIYVIGRDNVHWLFQQSDLKTDMLVIDEATSFKDRSTRRWASLMQKSITIGSKKYFRDKPMIDSFKYIVELTGTPASESYAGLWAQIAILTYGMENPLERTISLFRMKYMISQNFGGFPVYTKMRPGAISQINKKLEGLCISMRAEDYLQLPEKLEVVRYSTLNNKHYKQMETDGVITVDGVDIVAGDALTRYQKLQQISSGFIYDEQGRVHVLNHDKQDALMELLEETNENVLIIYKFDYEKKLLQNIGGVPLETPKAILDWQAGKIKIGLLYPGCAYGLNIQSSCSMVIYYTLPLSCEQHEQSVKRIWRQGQRNKVRIFYLLNRNTIDETVYNLLRDKKNVLDGLLSYFSLKKEKKL